MRPERGIIMMYVIFIQTNKTALFNNENPSVIYKGQEEIEILI